MGLSEITAVDGDTLAVIERDKLNGPPRRSSACTRSNSPASRASPGSARRASCPCSRSRSRSTCCPALRSGNGWTQEKLEGLTIGGDGEVYAVTDNDGLADATGETVFLRLGAASELF